MGMSAEIPPMDPYPLSHDGGHGMGGMAQMKGMKMSGIRQFKCRARKTCR